MKKRAEKQPPCATPIFVRISSLKLLSTLTFSLTLLMRMYIILISLSSRIVSNFSSNIFQLTVSYAFDMSIIIIMGL